MSARRVSALIFAVAIGSLASSRALGATDGAEPAVTCSLRPLKQAFMADETVRFEVRLCNASQVDISLPRALDGSEHHLRLPWTSTTTDGRPWQRGPRDCGFVNPMKVEDLVRLEPGACFDPHAGFPVRFSRPGRHEISVRHSTVGIPGGATSRWRADAEAADRLREIPEVDVTCTGSVRVLSKAARHRAR